MEKTFGEMPLGKRSDRKSEDMIVVNTGKNQQFIRGTLAEARSVAATIPNGKLIVGYMNGEKWYIAYNSRACAFAAGEESRIFEYYATSAEIPAALRPGERCPFCGAMKRGGWHNSASAANGKAKGGRPKKAAK